MNENILPGGVSEDALREFMVGLQKKLDEIGLYYEEGGIYGNPDDPDERFVLQIAFRVGDVAFLPRVQAPEQDKFDDDFRGIAASSVQEEAQRIRDKYGSNGK